MSSSMAAESSGSKSARHGRSRSKPSVDLRRSVVGIDESGANESELQQDSFASNASAYARSSSSNRQVPQRLSTTSRTSSASSAMGSGSGIRTSSASMSRETSGQGRHLRQTSLPLAKQMEAMGIDPQHASPSKSSSIHRPTLNEHCEFCLVAEFDIDRGSTLSHQYPGPIGHDEHLLAELMLPDGVHARSEDWTVFFLLSPDQVQNGERASKVSGSSGSYSTQSKASARENLIYVINLVRTKHDTSVRRGAMVKAIALGTRHPFIQAFRPALLLAIDDYFQNPSVDVLKRLYESLNSLDLSPMPKLTFHEKLILRASDRRDMFEERFGSARAASRSPSGHRRNGHLNSNGTGDHARYHPWTEKGAEKESDPPNHDEGTTNLLPPTSGASQSQKQMEASSQTRSRLVSKASFASMRQAASKNAGGSSIVGGSNRRAPSGQDDALTPRNPSAAAQWLREDDVEAAKQLDTRTWQSSVRYGKNATIYLTFPTDNFEREIGDYSLTQLVSIFGNSTPVGPQHPHLHSNGHLTPAIILLFNAVVTGKRVIFLGHNQPALLVATNVLSLCALGTGCGGAWQGVVRRCFPYANLGMLDELEQVPGYIAGVTNPRFEELRAWDVLCNIETGKITVSKDIAPAPSLPSRIDASMIGTTSAGSIASGIGPESDNLHHVTRQGTDSEHSHPQSGSTIRGQRSHSQIEARSDAADVVFMEEIQTAIAARLGERYLRVRFYEYAMNFLRLAARHEEYFYAHTTLAPSSQPFLNGQLGSGILMAERDAESRHVLANAQRIEGWRATDSYRLMRNTPPRIIKSTAVLGFDLGHQLARLRRARSLPWNECELIYIRIARGIKSPEQITELIALLPPHHGGLMTLSAGLFHPSSPVRNATLEIMARIVKHPAGRKAIQSLNTYHRLAFARLLHQRQEMVKRAQSANTAPSSGVNGSVTSPTSTLGSAPTPPSKSSGRLPGNGWPSAASNAIPAEFGGMPGQAAVHDGGGGRNLFSQKRSMPSLGVVSSNEAASSSSLGLGG